MPNVNTINPEYVRDRKPKSTTTTSKVSDGTKAYAGSGSVSLDLPSVGSLPGVKQTYDTSSKPYIAANQPAAQLAAAIGRYQPPTPQPASTAARPYVAPSGPVYSGSTAPAPRTPANTPGYGQSQSIADALGSKAPAATPQGIYDKPGVTMAAPPQPRTPANTPGYGPVPSLAADMAAKPPAATPQGIYDKPTMTPTFPAQPPQPRTPANTPGYGPVPGLDAGFNEVPRTPAGTPYSPAAPAVDPTTLVTVLGPPMVQPITGVDRMGYRSSGTRGYAPGHGQMTAPLMSRG